jgi:MerR family transcriptional regulator, thiopeptide resistance regulator
MADPEATKGGTSMSYTVGQVADFAAVTVRTLHHYDEIGLLSPNHRSRAGYRRYQEEDLARLQEILFYRELGFALDDIAIMLDDPDADHGQHLRRQCELLTGRVARLQQMLAAVEKAMEADKMGISLTPEERFEVFGDNDPRQHADEVAERWGGSDAYTQSQRRTKGYRKDDWLRIKTEATDLTNGLAAAMSRTTPADSVEAMDLAERHRQHISRWFYDCSYDIHVGLAGMYVSDPRFTANYDDVAPGLAQYMHDSILANAARQK